MKLKNKKICVNKKVVVVVSILALFILVLCGISYAYFTAVITGNDTAKATKVQTGTMSLKLDGTTITSLEGALPGDSHEITFSVTNTGTLTTSYGITLEEVINDFADKNDLVYSISSDNNGGSKTQSVVPSSNSTLIPAIVIEPGVTQNYTLKLEFLETEDDQNDNQGKTFSGRVQISSLEDSNYLSANILSNNSFITATPDFSIGEPPVSGTNTGSGLYAAEDDDGTSYYFRGAIDNNYVSFAGFTWQIVRINGDGSIRLILNGDTGTTSAFNETYTSHQYVGYTYNNESLCIKSSPCISDYNVRTGAFSNNKTMTNSTIKNYLENWYIDNLANYDNTIAL